jgi:thiosulfate/3-mercaptopyruvate sulfurtransferase
VLVGTAWLEGHHRDAGVRVVEVDVSPAAYAEGHVPGAVLWNVYRDLKDAEYHLVDDEHLEQLFARSGITPETTVVFYGYAPARGFWIMKRFGHADVRILDASRDTWRSEGRPWTADSEVPAVAVYRLPTEDGRLRARQPYVAEAIGDPSRTILDVRTEDEFLGGRFWPSGGDEPGGRAGHIPTAAHVPADGLFDPGGAFASTEALRGHYAAVDRDTEVIPYCTIGGRACTTWFVLSYLLGYERVRVYDGSWAEWGRLPGTRVERGRPS